MYRESCGCTVSPEQEEEIAEIRRNYLLYEETLLREIGRNAFMSVDLTGQRTLDDVVSKLFYFVYENIGFNRFCLCLSEDWDDFDRKKNGDIWQMSDNVEMVMGQNGKKGFVKIKFKRRELLPKELVDDEPMILSFIMIHHQGEYLGYAAIGFKENKTFMTSFQAWVSNICNALQNVIAWRV